MAELPKRHQLFIKEVARTGLTLESYLEVGYKETRSSLRRAKKLRRELAVHINREVRARLQSTDRVILANQTVEEIAADKDAPAAARLGAAKDIYAKAGLEEAPKAPVKEDKQMTDKELIAKIQELQGTLKLKLVAHDDG
jgi:hypothetical protein